MSQPLTTPPPGIQVRDLSLRFGARTIFERLSFDITGGSFVALLGASGAGKTSLLKILAGLENASSGTVSGSDGQPIAGRIAWMGQQDLLYPWLSVLQNITLGPRLRDERPDMSRAQLLLEQVGLGGHGDDLPAVLSGGMRQRAAIARTLYEDRPVVLMDEPFSALDAITRASIQTLAATLLAGRTVLLITHDPQEACRLSHRLLVLHRHPGGIDDGHTIAGLPPRAPDNADLLRSQGELMRQLSGEAE